jgi:hypothetical protein
MQEAGLFLHAGAHARSGGDNFIADLLPIQNQRTPSAMCTSQRGPGTVHTDADLLSTTQRCRWRRPWRLTHRSPARVLSQLAAGG